MFPCHWADKMHCVTSDRYSSSIRGFAVIGSQDVCAKYVTSNSSELRSHSRFRLLEISIKYHNLIHSSTRQKYVKYCLTLTLQLLSNTSNRQTPINSIAGILAPVKSDHFNCHIISLCHELTLWICSLDVVDRIASMNCLPAYNMARPLTSIFLSSLLGMPLILF